MYANYSVNNYIDVNYIKGLQLKCDHKSNYLYNDDLDSTLVN